MSEKVSLRRKRVKAELDGIEEFELLTARYQKYLAKCRQEGCPEHVQLLAIYMGVAALRFIHLNDGRDTAENVLGAIKDIINNWSEFDDIETGTRH